MKREREQERRCDLRTKAEFDETELARSELSRNV